MKVVLRDGFGKLTDKIVDLGRLKAQKQAGGVHMIWRDEAGNVIGGIRLAHGLVLSIEGDGSMNTSPVSEFEVSAENDLNRIGDPNMPKVISVVMPLALTQAMMAQEDHPANGGPVRPTDRKGNPKPRTDNPA